MSFDTDAVISEYHTLLARISQLEQNQDTNTYSRLQFVLSPFVMSLGYDIFKVNETIINHTSGYINCNLTDESSISFTINPEYFPEEEDIWILCVLDLDNNALILKSKFLGDWRTGISLHLNDEKDNILLFPDLWKLTYKKSLLTGLNNYGKKLISDSVVSLELIKDGMDNDFIKDVLEDEFNNPSKELLEIIAHRLQEKYSMTSDKDLIDILNYSQSISTLNSFIELNKNEYENNYFIDNNENMSYNESNSLNKPILPQQDSTGRVSLGDLSEITKTN